MKRNIEEGQSNVTPNQEEKGIHYNIWEAIEQDDVNQMSVLITQGVNLTDFNEKRQQSALEFAVYKNALKCLEYLLEKQHFEILEILHCAAEYGRAEVIDKLIKLGADIEARDSEEMTTLHYAAVCGKVEIIAKLIELGADITAKNARGSTALHIAAEEGSVEAIVKLIELGADIEARDSEEMTPLLIAALWRDVETIAKLIELGANINVQDFYRRTAFHLLAEMHGDAKAAAIDKLIKAGADNINAQDYEEMTALHRAAGYGKVEIIDKLIKAGADINVQDIKGYTALHNATAYGKLEVIVKLVELGADIDTQDTEGCTALHLVANYGSAEVIVKLVELGADINIKNKKGHTALDIAEGREFEFLETNLYEVAEFGDAKCTAKLIALGADINAQDTEGRTPLHRAASSGRVEVIEKLIKAGSDINARDTEGKTPLHSAASSGHLDAIVKLIELGAYVGTQNTLLGLGSTVLHYAASSGNVEVIAKLIDAGVDINVQDTGGCTALHYAASSGNVGAVEKLIELGAYVNTSNRGGSTALYYAAEYGRVEVIEKLIKAGACINAKDTIGCTALYYAASSGRVEAVEKLIKAGSDINVQNNNGRTVLEHLAVSGEGYDIFSQHPPGWNISQVSLDCFKLLLEHGAVFHSAGYGYQICHTWAGIAGVIRDFCHLRDYGHNLQVLNQVNPEELAVFSKNIMTNCLINSGIGNHYPARFKEACTKLPPALAQSLLSHLDKQIAAGEEQLRIVDAILIAKTQDLGHLPYNVLIKSGSEKEKTPEAEQKLLEFYESNPAYKTAGQYFLDLAQQSTEVENISDINYIMILHKDVADLILELNKCILFRELKAKIEQIVTKHNEYKNNPVMHALIKQQGTNEEQSVLIKIQAKDLENQQKEIVSLKACSEKQEKEIVSLKAFLGKIMQFMTTQNSDFAEYMGIELAHPNAAVNDNDIDVIGDLQNVNSDVLN